MELSRKIIVTSALFLFAVTSQSQSLNEKKLSSSMTNPLLQRSTLQYQAPPFNLIKDEHFKPAFEYSLKIHDKEIEKIANTLRAQGEPDYIEEITLQDSKDNTASRLLAGVLLLLCATAVGLLVQSGLP